MTRRIFIDIETLPPVEAVRTEVAREVARELTTQGVEFDEEKLLNLTDQRFRDLALRGDAGRLLTIGLIIEQDREVKHHGLLGRDRDSRRFHLDEAQTLQSFWKLMKEFNHREDQIIGHNIYGFDLPFIYQRSIINRVVPSIKLSFARYRSQPIYDTMCEWGGWNQRIKLPALTAALGIANPKSNGIDGGSVYHHFLAEKHEEIACYCMRDVEATREVYYRLNYLDAPRLESYQSKIANQQSAGQPSASQQSAGQQSAGQPAKAQVQLSAIIAARSAA